MWSIRKMLKTSVVFSIRRCHQRYFDFEPKKFYVEDIQEARWRYHPQEPYGDGGTGYVRLEDPLGGLLATQALIPAGVFAIFANNDQSVLQLLPPAQRNHSTLVPNIRTPSSFKREARPFTSPARHSRVKN